MTRPTGNPKGRPSKAVKYESVQDKIDLTADDAIDLLSTVIARRKGYKRIGDSVLKACYFVIDHAIGKAKQKIEHSGGVLTYGELVRSAEELATKQPELLINVEKIGKN